jgi:hypothetical protein
VRTSLVSFNPPAMSAIFGGGSLESPRHTPPLIEIGYNPKLSSEIITISETEPPGRRLLLRMIDVQRLLSRVNQRVLTGLSVDRNDWEEIRNVCSALGDAFVNEVQFAWETPRESLVGAAASAAIREGEEDEDHTESNRDADLEANDSENGLQSFRSRRRVTG